jgi:hypothetical protein
MSRIRFEAGAFHIHKGQQAREAGNALVSTQFTYLDVGVNVICWPGPTVPTKLLCT